MQGGMPSTFRPAFPSPPALASAWDNAGSRVFASKNQNPPTTTLAIMTLYLFFVFAFSCSLSSPLGFESKVDYYQWVPRPEYTYCSCLAVRRQSAIDTQVTRPGEATLVTWRFRTFAPKTRWFGPG